MAVQFLQYPEALQTVGKDPISEEKRNKILGILPQSITSAELMQKEFEDPVWIIPEIIPEGLTIIAGSPKVGKSWLALNIAIALSVGGRVLGSIKIQKMTVLYLALEDTQRRLKNRLDTLNALPSPDLHLVTEWKQADKGIDNLVLWKDVYPQTGLIIIDTLQKFRGLSLNGNTYETDYNEIAQLKMIADRIETPIIVLHHTRKMGSYDPLQTVSGTIGITGPADTVIVLKRSRRQSDAELFVTGRDVEDKELALRFEDPIGWVLMGDAEEYRQTNERQAVLEVIKEAEEPISPAEIAVIVEKTPAAVRYLVKKLKDEGYVRQEEYGKYVIA